jgi:signal transduction histidine kinase
MEQVTLVEVFIYSFFVFSLILIFIFILIRYHFNSRLVLIEEMNKKQLEMEREINRAKDEWSSEVANNISTELHDNINQMLAIIRLQISNLEGKMSDSAFLPIITKVKDEISLTIDSIRSVSRILSKDHFDKFNFVSAIYNQKDAIEMSSNIQVKLGIDSDPSQHMEKSGQITLFRIIQEFIQNAIKYSECTELTISSSEIKGQLLITLGDNGIGFNTELAQSGLGLNHIMKRSEAIGATFKLETSPGMGTKMLLSLPAVHQN